MEERETSPWLGFQACVCASFAAKQLCHFGVDPFTPVTLTFWISDTSAPFPARIPSVPRALDGQAQQKRCTGSGQTLQAIA